ncbi:MAG: NADP-dependent malic enzyme [Devosia sp. 67-54]|uniref:NADP-dependent malic enzyme n=1 Tax=unclassified Devosia TaxID=196773 RepID=UPI000960B304|nr:MULTISPECIES: NADP-dependent malic enzyme [unclassified Devosia]MBN9306173.1 NADP-dependent malic enzyme [Devosia sp.]OJX18254.1 MAG: NADP-dependent malic enzyme [Devosia sp. 67-54]
MSDVSEQLLARREAALHFHEHPKPGKLEIQPTKPLGNQRDLSLAYSPGVAAPCEVIADDPEAVFKYTSKGNLVAVISNGTAVLGLGAIGALASKPVMEGKAVLFKKFAGIDVFDIEVDETDPKKFIEVVRPLEPTFGGINLEDIKAPECFEIEEALRERMKIPVFHDDQHGTAIIVGAAVLNGLELAGKNIAEVKICTSGAGAAAIACLNMLIALGAKLENIWVADKDGLLTYRRNDVNDKWRGKFCRHDTEATALAEVIDGADIFLGLSAAGALKPEMLQRMAPNPLVLALANPNPEIMPEDAKAVRPDAMVCTGRSDYSNQVNNVLCFPFIFRGALDVGATAINEEMKVAASYAIAKLAHDPGLEVSPTGQPAVYGPEHIIPNPFDQRLILRIAPAVARAAMDTGVARRPITDFVAYQDSLNRFVFRSGLVMKPIIDRAQGKGKRIAFADGEEERVLRAVQVLIEDRIASPILIGRPQVIESRIKRFGLNLNVDRLEIINPEDDPRYRDYVALFHSLVGRSGVTPETARTIVRTNTTTIAALAVKRGEADAMLCGLQGRFIKHMRDIRSILGVQDGISNLSALSMLIMPRGAFFLTDTYVNIDPTADEIVAIALQARSHLKRFNIEAKAALLSYSNFGSRDGDSAFKMREVYRMLQTIAPNFIVEGEMQGDLALNQELRERYIPDTVLRGEANLLIFPNLESANLSMTLLKEMTNALAVGPILMGTRVPAHILAPSTTSRGIVNMAAIAASEAVSLDAEA